MRVAIDATPLTLSSGGLARYTSELTLALSAQFPEDEYTLMSPVGQVPDLPSSRLELGGSRQRDCDDPIGMDAEVVDCLSADSFTIGDDHGSDA